MRSIVTRIGVDTHHDAEMIDITHRVQDVVRDAGVSSGVVYINTLHTTTGITINEGLPDVEDDILGFLSRLVPRDHPYRHSRFLPSDGEMAVNATSHLRSALLGMQVSFPIENGEMVRGQRQTIYFVELDGPLHREAVVHVMGE
jgi:secondary thiamine-phosphate synthase enzyme